MENVWTLKPKITKVFYPNQHNFWKEFMKDQVLLPVKMGKWNVYVMNLQNMETNVNPSVKEKQKSTPNTIIANAKEQTMEPISKI